LLLETPDKLTVKEYSCLHAKKAAYADAVFYQLKSISPVTQRRPVKMLGINNMLMGKGRKNALLDTTHTRKQLIEKKRCLFGYYK
jgi:hypothetical protein